MPAELTVTEAMVFSGYTRCHLYNLVTSSRIRARRVKPRAAPTLILIEKTSLEAYMQSKGRSVNGEQTINR